MKVRNGFVTNSSSSSFIAIMKGTLSEGYHFNYSVEDCCGDYENTRATLNQLHMSIGDSNPELFPDDSLDVRSAIFSVDNMLITSILNASVKTMRNLLSHPFDFMQLEIPDPESNEFVEFCQYYVFDEEMEAAKKLFSDIYYAVAQNDQVFKSSFRKKSDLNTLYLSFSYGGRGEGLEDPIDISSCFFSDFLWNKVLQPLSRREKKRKQQGEEEISIRADRIKNNRELKLFDKESINNIVRFILAFSCDDSYETAKYYDTGALCIEQSWNLNTGLCTFRYGFDRFPE